MAKIRMTLEEELAELERTDPKVKKAADKYEQTKAKIISQFDIEMGHPDPCSHCGFAWSVPRCQDGLCPGLHENGTLWRGSWDLSKGTTYKP